MIDADENYREIVQHSPMGIHQYKLDKNNSLIFINSNPAADSILRLNHADLRGLPIHEAFPGHTIDGPIPKLYIQVIRGEVSATRQQISYTDATHDVSGVFDLYVFKTGEDTCTVEFLDITERIRVQENLERSLKEKEVLLQEVHHRVKNNLQITISLLNLQLEKFTEPEMITAFTEAITRLQVMALSYQALYLSDDFSKLNMKLFIKEVTSIIHYMWSTKTSIRINFDLCEFTFNIDRAIPCVLILNELLTNVLKHAFPTSEKWDPEIVIASRIVEDNIEISIKDNGIGIRTPSLEPGLGTALIDGLIRQLHGTIEYYRNGGTKITLRIPCKDSCRY